jgi:hypothetical protein
MAGEIQVKHESGRNLYYHIRDRNSLIWNGSSFETYNGSNYTTYSLSLSEQGSSGFYKADFPNAAPGVYFLIGYERAGGSPAEGDRSLVGGEIHWDGAEEVGFSDTPTDIHVNGNIDDVDPAVGSFKGNSALSNLDGFYNKGVIAFVSGTLKGIARRVEDYVGSTRTFVLDENLPVAPSNGDRFRFLGRIE